MSKFSVKKPLTVFVAVIAVLVLGVVAYLKMTPDLFPNMDFPYVVIMTTYPGASPESVEREITRPMEQSMSTLEHIKEVSSSSSENYSMVMLEFDDDVNMDTIGVDIQQNLSTLSEGWAETVGTPYVLKINPSMIPVEVAAVSMDGMDNVALTELLDDTLMNQLEGIAGVARITTAGAVNQEIHVVLDQEKIDAKNAEIQAAVNSKLDEAEAELNEQKAELEEAQAALEEAQSQLASGQSQLSSQTALGEAEINRQQTELLKTRAELQVQRAQLESGRTQLEASLQGLTALRDSRAALVSQADALQQNVQEMQQLAQTLESIDAAQLAFDAQIAAIRGSTTMTPEEIEAAVADIENSAEYLNLQAQRAQAEAQLAALGMDRTALDAAIVQSVAGLAEVQIGIAQIDSTLTAQGMSSAELDAQIAELQGSLTELESGVAQLDDAMQQLDSGMLQIQDAQKLLSQQKTNGLLEMSSAAAEIAANNASVSMGLTQIESGFDTLESSREAALEQADLREILTMDMVSSILKAQNFSMPAGYVEQEGVSYMVSVGDEMTEEDELNQLVLFDPGIEGVGAVHLSDVAEIMLTDNRSETYARLNGLDGIVLSFEKQSTYATAAVTENIAARFAALEAEYDGLHFVALMDQGDYIYLIVNTILQSLLVGAILAILILLIFLRDLRPTFITLCSIPISVIFAVVLMYFSGVTLNMISLSGLAVAVGMLVDNSVVVIENIYRLRAKGANALQAAVSGAKQVAGAVTASTLTTVCVFLPIVFVEGLTRQLFTDLALTMSFALLASLIVSLTLVPAMAAGMLRKEKVHKPGFFDRVLAGYRRAAAWALKYKALVLLSSLALLALSGLFCLRRGFSFMPEIDMPNVNVTITMPEDAGMEEAAALADEVLARIDTLDGIETVGAMMSSGGLMGGGGGAYDVTAYITLADEKASGAEMGKKIEKLCADLDCEVTASSQMMDMSMMTGSGITLQIYADDMEVLQQAAVRAAEVLAGVEGTAEISDGLEDAVPALHIAIDRNAAMEKGMTVAQIYMALAADLQNTATATVMELGGNSTDVIVETPEETQLQRSDLEDYVLEVTAQDGTTTSFRLGDVAEIEETTSLNTISRLNQRRYLRVTASIAEGENVTLVTNDAIKAMESADLGEDVTYAFAGENESIMDAVEQLLLMLLLGVLLVYLVMVAQFQSLKSPFIVMFTIPLAFTGGFLALLITGMEISVVSLIGFVMLTGIIVNNGIVLVDYINQLRRDGVERREAIIEAGVTRIRPILMTSLTTILGLVDMAFGRSAGTALMQPVAAVCIGGLLYATLMTLFVVPCMYDILNRRALRKVTDSDLEIPDV